MNNQWTGGQYSIFRILLGSYLIIHFVHLLPWATEIFSSAGMLADGELSPLMAVFPNLFHLNDSPGMVLAVVGSGAVAAVFFTLGYHDKPAAVWMWFVLACLLGRNPLTSNPSLPYVGWMLLAHCFIPAHPYGSLSARGRPDPKGEWIMPNHIFLAGWLVLALSYSYSGYTKLLSPSWVSGDNVLFVLQNPIARDWFLHDLFLALPEWLLAGITWAILYIELLFAPLALIRKIRPWIWGAMLVVQFGFLSLLNFADLTFGMLMIHLFTFDPAWLPPRRQEEKTVVYYDGDCGLCHRIVRWILAEDRTAHFNFAPQSSPAFKKWLAQSGVTLQNETLVVVNEKGSAYFQGDAVVYILQQLGGLWRLGGMLFDALPKPLRDRAYRFVGQRRYRWFGKTETVCPLLPDHYSVRFESH